MEKILLKQPTGIFKSIVIKQEVSDPATGKQKLGYTPTKGDVVKIGKETLSVTLENGLHIEDYTDDLGPKIKMWTAGLISGYSEYSRTTSMSFDLSADGPKLYFQKNEIKETILQDGAILLDVDMDSLTNHQYNSHILINDKNGNNIEAYNSGECGKLPVRRRDDGNYEVAGYFIAPIISKTEIK